MKPVKISMHNLLSALRRRGFAAAVTLVVALWLMSSCAAMAPALVGSMSGVLAGTTANKTSKKQKKASKKDAEKYQVIPREQRLSANDRMRFDHFFLEAVRLQNAEKFDAAFDLLRRCIEIDSLAPEPYFKLSAYYTELNQDTLALAYLEKAERLNPHNDTYHENVARYYIGMKRYDKATVAYENLLRDNTQRTDVLNILLQLYTQSRDYDNMLRTIERIEQLEGVSEETTLSKMRTYELKGDKDMAFKTLKALSDKHPSDVNYKVMLGNWLMSNGDKEQAFGILNAALADEPNNGYAQSSMYDYYKSVGQDSLATILRDDILLSNRTPMKTKLTMLQQLIRDSEKAGGDSTEILSVFNRMMAANPKETDVALLESVYMTVKKMPQDTINQVYRHILSVEPDNVNARLPLIEHSWRQQNWQEVVELCSTGAQYNPDEMAFYYYMGLAYYLHDDEDGALDALTRGVAQITDKTNPNLASDFYCIMGDILHKKGRVGEAYAAYDSCLHWKEDNMQCLNNYAYFLSEEGGDLKKAEDMSFKTVKAEPTNVNNLDTYAWILFRQGRYEESKIYIDQALRNDTDSVPNAVVIEHAGDIYYMTGRTDEALQYWRRAFDTGEGTAILPKKIRQKKYIPDEKKQK